MDPRQCAWASRGAAIRVLGTLRILRTVATRGSEHSSVVKVPKVPKLPQASVSLAIMFAVLRLVVVETGHAPSLRWQT